MLADSWTEQDDRILEEIYRDRGARRSSSWGRSAVLDQFGSRTLSCFAEQSAKVVSGQLSVAEDFRGHILACCYSFGVLGKLVGVRGGRRVVGGGRPCQARTRHIRGRTILRAYRRCGGPPPIHSPRTGACRTGPPRVPTPGNCFLVGQTRASGQAELRQPKPEHWSRFTRTSRADRLSS
jgi:hypothetical protein